MDNFESQEMELVALQHMYEAKDFKVESMDPPSGCFFANVRLADNFCIKYKHANNNSECDLEGNDTEVEDEFTVEHLPPIHVFFLFPKSYPQQTCPAFLLSCNWLTLTQLTCLCKQLEVLWEASHDSVMYSWFHFLQNESLEFLNISDFIDITELLEYKVSEKINLMRETDCLNEFNSPKQSAKADKAGINYLANIGPSITGGSGDIDVRALNDISDGKMLIQRLKHFNEYKKVEVFNCSSHVCNICFLSKIGTDFVTFHSCQHSFCSDCIKSYFEVQIIDGNVNSLNCPEDKCLTQADGTIVRQVVSEELYEKYDKLLLSRTLEGMSDVTFCPRQECQCPVLLEPCGRMGSCSACSFVFCALCKMAYHGVAHCKLKSEQSKSIFQLYSEGDTSARESLEKQYGKQFVKQIVENIMSEDWVNCNSKNCPHCKASIEKIEGCNKMTCFKCGSYFCWLCMKHLPMSNPYSHFRGSNNRCELFPH